MRGQFDKDEIEIMEQLVAGNITKICSCVRKVIGKVAMALMQALKLREQKHQILHF